MEDSVVMSFRQYEKLSKFEYLKGKIVNIALFKPLHKIAHERTITHYISSNRIEWPLHK